MSFKMLNGVEVYDKSEVDGIVESINATSTQHTSDINQLKTKTNSLDNSKANTAQVRDLENRTTTVEQRLTGTESNISEHSNRITALENNSATVEQMNQGLNAKADSNYAQQTRQIANNNKSSITELEARATALEANKVAKSEVTSMVDSEIDNVINAKVAGITSDINHIVDNAVDDALDSYDDSNTVDQKIADAAPVAMSTAEATALVDQYF